MSRRRATYALTRPPAVNPKPKATNKRQSVWRKSFGGSSNPAPLTMVGGRDRAGESARALEFEVAPDNSAQEQEADAVADLVVGTSLHYASELPQYRSRLRGLAPVAQPSTPVFEHRGSSLPPSLRANFEPLFGVSLSHIRVHDDAESHRMARTFRARAFTVGKSDIAFASLAYRPDSLEGQHLIAHEITHTLQNVGTSGLETDSEGPRETQQPVARPAKPVARPAKPVTPIETAPEQVPEPESLEDEIEGVEPDQASSTSAGVGENPEDNAARHARWPRLRKLLTRLRERFVPAKTQTSDQATILIDTGPLAAPTQRTKSEFLDQLESALRAVANAELARVGQSAEQCPYLLYWMRYARRQDAAGLERLARLFISTPATSARELQAALVDRVRLDLMAWIETGDLPTIPTAEAGLPTGLVNGRPGPGSDALPVAQGRWEAVVPLTPRAVQHQLGTGSRLPTDHRLRMEEAFGASFTDVRVHADAKAEQITKGLGARALALGSDIAFARGEFRPGTRDGDVLLAHELAHVLQQRQGGGTKTTSETETSRLEDNANLTLLQAVRRLLLDAGPVPSPMGTGLRLQMCKKPDPIVHEIDVADQTAADFNDPGYGDPIANPMEFKIDADGDQERELNIQFTSVTYGEDEYPSHVQIEVTQLSSGETRMTTFELSGRGDLSPAMLDAANGKDHLRIELTESDGSDDLGMPSSDILSISPPTVSAADYTYELGMSEGQTPVQMTFPADPGPLFEVFDYKRTEVEVGVWSIEFEAGAYRDPFRVTFAKTEDDTLTIGVAGISDPDGDSDFDAIGGDTLTMEWPSDRRLDVWVLRGSATELVFDLDGDGEADLRLYDGLRGEDSYEYTGASRDTDRVHTLAFHVADSNVVLESRWNIDAGKLIAGGTPVRRDGFEGAAQSAVIDEMPQVAGTGGYLEAVLGIEQGRSAIRKRVLMGGNLSLGTSRTWRYVEAAFEALVVAHIEETSRGPDSEKLGEAEMSQGARDICADRVMALYRSLSEEDESKFDVKTFERLAKLIRDNDIEDAIELYFEFLDEFDLWLASRLEEEWATVDGAGEPLLNLKKMADLLAGIDKYNPVKVPAILYSEQVFESEAQARGVPLQLYYYKGNDDEWHLVDYTRPDETLEVQVDVTGSGYNEPPTAIFDKLNFPDHYPSGRIFYELPISGKSGSTKVDGGMQWKDALAWASLALVVAGAVVLSGGTAAPVIGTVLVASGSTLGAISAGADMVQHAQHKTLTLARGSLDVLQIAASIAGLGAVVAIPVKSAQGASLLVRATGISASASQTVALRAIQIGVTADVLSFAVMTEEAYVQIDKIMKSPAETRDKVRMLSLTLGNLVLMGALTMVSVRGAKALPDADVKSLDIDLDHHVKGGGDTPADVDVDGASARGRGDDPGMAPGSKRAGVDATRDFEPGRIRPETELSNAQVVKALEDQLLKISPDQVDGIIARFPGQEAEARLVLSRSSGFGNIESFNDLRVAMDDALSKGSRLYKPGSGSLADNLHYSSKKQSYRRVDGVDHKPEKRVVDTTKLEPDAVVILDEVVLHQIESDPKFAQDLIDFNCILLEPRGFVSGINLYNAPTSDVITKHTRRLLDRAVEIQAAGTGESVSFEAALELALSEETDAILKRANPALLNRKTVVDPTAGAGQGSGGISTQLSGKAGLTEQEFAAEIAKKDPATQVMIRELLVHQAQVYSPRRFAKVIVKQHEALMAKAKGGGIKADEVFFYIPLPNKSYGMLAMAHRQATGMPVGRYINGVKELDMRMQTGELHANTMLVILDDVAASGDSLHQEVVRIGKGTYPDDPWVTAEVQYQGRVVVSPMVSTQAAKDLFANPKKGLGKIQGLEFAPGEVSLGLKASAFYQGLDAGQKKVLLNLVGKLGWGETGLSMAFPYMSPDNNNNLFYELFARYFIANRNQKAAKPPAQ